MEFSTMSKGTSAIVKTRGALKQALFSQGVSDKNSTLEVIHFLPKLGMDAGGTFSVFVLNDIFFLLHFCSFSLSTGAGGCTETSSGLFQHTC